MSEVPLHLTLRSRLLGVGCRVWGVGPYSGPGGGGAVSYERGTPVATQRLETGKGGQIGNNLKRFEDFYLKARARIWP